MTPDDFFDDPSGIRKILREQREFERMFDSRTQLEKLLGRQAIEAAEELERISKYVGPDPDLFQSAMLLDSSLEYAREMSRARSAFHAARELIEQSNAESAVWRAAKKFHESAVAELTSTWSYEEQVRKLLDSSQALAIHPKELFGPDPLDEIRELLGSVWPRGANFGEIDFSEFSLDDLADVEDELDDAGRQKRFRVALLLFDFLLGRLGLPSFSALCKESPVLGRLLFVAWITTYLVGDVRTDTHHSSETTESEAQACSRSERPANRAIVDVTEDSYVNLRAAPSLRGEVIGELRRAAVVAVQDEAVYADGEEWICVDVSQGHLGNQDGRSGWVAARFMIRFFAQER